jgi:hypothetical protein
MEYVIPYLYLRENTEEIITLSSGKDMCGGKRDILSYFLGGFM